MTTNNPLIGLADHMAIYADSDYKACQIRYKFLALLRDDPLYPFMESEFRMVQYALWELTGQGLGVEGEYGGQWGSKGPGFYSLYESREPRAWQTLRAFYEVMGYLADTFAEAAGSRGTPIPLGQYYGWEGEWRGHSDPS